MNPTPQVVHEARGSFGTDEQLLRWLSATFDEAERLHNTGNPMTHRVLSTVSRCFVFARAAGKRSITGELLGYHKYRELCAIERMILVRSAFTAAALGLIMGWMLGIAAGFWFFLGSWALVITTVNLRADRVCELVHVKYYVEFARSLAWLQCATFESHGTPCKEEPVVQLGFVDRPYSEIEQAVLGYLKRELSFSSVRFEQAYEHARNLGLVNERREDLRKRLTAPVKVGE